VDVEEGVAKVQAILEAVRPDAVLTFGPDGLTGHPDHQAVSAWTTAAFQRAAPPGARLYYATTTPEWAAAWCPRLARFNTFAPGTPPITPRATLAIAEECDGDLLALKMAAIQEHRSQVEGLLAAFGTETMADGVRGEYFRLGAAAA